VVNLFVRGKAFKIVPRVSNGKGGEAWVGKGMVTFKTVMFCLLAFQELITPGFQNSIESHPLI